ncbi:MAG: hypothetical protein ACP5TO_04490 [Thermoplasmata archaeon]
MFLKSDYNFIIGAAYIFKEIKCIALMSKRDIESAEHMLRIEDNIIFYREAKMVLDGEDLSFYLYYDINREKDEKGRFYLR